MHITNNLSDLPLGQRATVSEIQSKGTIRRRLQDIGLIPGTQVTCLQRSPLGDPSAYLIRGAVIAIRKEDSSSVLVQEGGN